MVDGSLPPLLHVGSLGAAPRGSSLASTLNPPSLNTEPLLPQFKLIDFGISKMSAKLAQAAGGREAQVRRQTHQRGCRRAALQAAHPA